jgi:hypothetical protein
MQAKAAPTSYIRNMAAENKILFIRRGSGLFSLSLSKAGHDVYAPLLNQIDPPPADS